MLNIRRLLMIWLCVLADICIYSTCIFLVIEEYTGTFWVSYTSTIVSFVFYSAAIFVIGKKGRRVMKMKLAVPFLSYLNIGLGIQIFVGTVFLKLPFSIGVVTIFEVFLQAFLVTEGIYILRYYL